MLLHQHNHICEIGNKTEITVVARAEAFAPEAEMMLAGMQSGWNQVCSA